METFVKCLFSDSHMIGNRGTVKRLEKSRIERYGTDLLKGMIKPDGYKLYHIKGKWHYAHRLVAIHYLSNGNNYTDVNHKDGNKINNCVENLEWCTHSYNIQHSFDVLGRTIPKGENHYSFGKIVNQATKDKMSLAKKGKKRSGNGGKWL